MTPGRAAVVAMLAGVFAGCAAVVHPSERGLRMRPDIPLGLDLYMPVPADNPLTEAKIELGRKLFFDRRLSRDESLSCASCHDPDRAFSSPAPVARGVFGRVGRRNAPALVNRGYGRAFFWDGRTTTLEEQVLRPIQDPNEMDLTLEEASGRLNMSVEALSQALSSYVRSQLFGESPFDRFIAGNRTALSEDAEAGLRLFRGRANCTSCHVGPTFTDERFHNTGVAWQDAAADSEEPGVLMDEGRFLVTGDPDERGAFKTPTLREVVRTAPYMHDGSLSTLEEVIDFYDRGGRSNPNLDPLLRPLRLSEAEKRQLEAFLWSLASLTPQ